MKQRIGIVTYNLSFYKALNAIVLKDANFELVLIKSPLFLSQIEQMEKSVDAFIIDDSSSLSEIIQIGKILKKSSIYNKSSVYLAIENFALYKKVVIEECYSTVKTINMPSTVNEIYTQVTIELINAKADNQAKSGTSNAAFLNIFIDATMSTIKEMTGCKTMTYNPVEPLNYAKIEPEIAIRGKLLIKSPYFSGGFFISFPEQAFLNVSGSVLLQKFTVIDKENEDLASEITNIIYGKSKVAISKLGMKMDMAIPTYNKEAKALNCDKVCTVKFNTELGSFYVKIAPGLAA